MKKCAEILYEGFKDIWPYICPDIPAAASEVQKALTPGWIGAVPEYDGHAWILASIAVHAAFRERGVGRALVQDLEAKVREQGATTLFLGTDDTLGMTSLGGRDLYPNVLEQAANIKNFDRHPFEFYQKLGYAIVGVIPDANGFGKPDIFMAKRLTDL